MAAFKKPGFKPRSDRPQFARKSFGGPRKRDEGERPEMFSAVCADCGKKCEVPFRPGNGRPVFCKDCFTEKKEMPHASYTRDMPRAKQDDTGAQLDALNKKLDRIIKMLEDR